jgi:hypothetical protein
MPNEMKCIKKKRHMKPSIKKIGSKLTKDGFTLTNVGVGPKGPTFHFMKSF